MEVPDADEDPPGVPRVRRGRRASGDAAAGPRVVRVLPRWRPGGLRWALFALCLVQYGLVHLQLRLGLGSNDDAALLAYHVPLGVLIFFLACLTMALAFGVRVESSQA